MLQERPKICRACRFHVGRGGEVVRVDLCTYDQTLDPNDVDVVTGAPNRMEVGCHAMREKGGRCGPEGALWQAKHIDIPKPRDNGWRSGSTGDADWSR